MSWTSITSERARSENAISATAPHSANGRSKETMIFPARFAGKVAVVTGAAQGIGRSVARRIAHEGGKLALVDRSPLVAEVQQEAEGAGAEAIASIADLETFSGPPSQSMEHWRASAVSTSWSIMSVARFGQSLMPSTQRHRSKPRSAARSSQRCGAAVPCCQQCWSVKPVSSLTCLQLRRAA